MAFWLVKSEPSVYSIADLERDGATGWDGVRNHVAKNHLRSMKVGDRLLFYHSNADPPGVAGTATVRREAYPDPTQFDPDDDHHDPKATPERPLWWQVDVAFASRFPRLVSLDELKEAPELEGMLLTSGKASRLSVQPVEERHYEAIVRRGEAKGPSTKP